MPHEHQPHHHPRDAFQLTEREQRDYRISAARFFTILNDENTQIHAVRLDLNSYGEYLFVTLSRQGQGMTFYGLGYHEQREQWVKDVWYWYENNPIDSLYCQTIPKGEALAQIEARQREIAAEDDPTPSERAMLFALFADLTDEDGALAELEDMPPLE